MKRLNLLFCLFLLCVFSAPIFAATYQPTVLLPTACWSNDSIPIDLLAALSDDVCSLVTGSVVEMDVEPSVPGHAVRVFDSVHMRFVYVWVTDDPSSGSGTNGEGF